MALLQKSESNLKKMTFVELSDIFITFALKAKDIPLSLPPTSRVGAVG